MYPSPRRGVSEIVASRGDARRLGRFDEADNVRGLPANLMLAGTLAGAWRYERRLLRALRPDLGDRASAQQAFGYIQEAIRAS